MAFWATRREGGFALYLVFPLDLPWWSCGSLVCARVVRRQKKLTIVVMATTKLNTLAIFPRTMKASVLPLEGIAVRIVCLAGKVGVIVVVVLSELGMEVAGLVLVIG
jgi:hypothetical protein